MAKAKKTTTTKKTGPKQAELKGMGRKRDKELDRVIMALYEVRIERLALQVTEAELSSSLLEKLKAKKLKAYSCFDGDVEYPAILKPGVEKVSISKKEPK